MFELMKIGEVVVNVDANGRYCLNDLHKTSYDVYGRAVVSAKFTPKGFAYIAERISK